MSSSNSTRDRAISLLGQGFSNSQVAAAIGVTPAWISQLLEEDTVKEEVARLRSAVLESRAEADTTLERLEKAALKLVEDKMPFVRNPLEATKIFTALNSAKRKTGNNSPEQDALQVATVTITLPRAAAAVHIQLNQENQVIEVEGRSMATLPSRSLAQLGSSNQYAPALSAPVPTVQDIQAVTRQRLQKQDAVRAEEVLARVRDVTVMLNGVESIL